MEKLLKYLFWVLLFSVLQIKINANSPPNEIYLPRGSKLKGLIESSFYSKKKYVEFRGLRYAKPPIGDLRFKPTQLFDDIEESLGTEAIAYGKICPQLDPWYDPSEEENGSWDDLKVLGDEDCLFANVATSSINPEKPLPVLIWIHGGNFQSESGQDYGVGKLMEHDMVVVTFNSRLGLLGFLNSEDGIYNGNQGLKDQTLLLKWVKNIIHLFGGDPNKITLAGSNSGGVSVHLHSIANYSKGLFNRAIIQSGTAISPWVLMKEPKPRLQLLSKFLHCDNNTDTVSCITHKSATEIIQKTQKIMEWYLDPLVPFGPSIEMFGDTKDRFLVKDPYEILAEQSYWAKDVPIIMGVNSHEGLLHAMDIGHQGMLRMVFNREWFGSGPISLYYKTSSIDPRSISEEVRNYYFPITEEDRLKNSTRLVDKDYKFDNLTNLYSDRHFFVPLHHSAKLMGSLNKLYLHWFDYVSNQSIHALYGYNSSHIFGPSHYDQLQYMFITPFFTEMAEDTHVDFEKKFTKELYAFMSNSASFSDKWRRVTNRMVEGTESFIYNRIGQLSEPLHVTEPFAKRVEFWNSLLLMEYEKSNLVNALVKEHESNAHQKNEL